MKKIDNKFIDRVIDANLNRAKEGLRVCEDIFRFIIESSSLTGEFKKVRHTLDLAIKSYAKREQLLAVRDSISDIGFNIYLKKEYKRSGIRDIFYANIQRVKESIRVLEEFSKLNNIAASKHFKKIRYMVYDVEKNAAKKFKVS